jgi:hypothetical protein
VKRRTAVTVGVAAAGVIAIAAAVLLLSRRDAGWIDVRNVTTYGVGDRCFRVHAIDFSQCDTSRIRVSFKQLRDGAIVSQSDIPIPARSYPHPWIVVVANTVDRPSIIYRLSTTSPDDRDRFHFHRLLDDGESLVPGGGGAHVGMPREWVFAAMGVGPEGDAAFRHDPGWTGPGVCETLAQLAEYSKRHAALDFYCVHVEPKR